MAAPFYPKARQWKQGRVGVMDYLQANIAATDKTIWMHCASLGEFEQGRPLLEALRMNYPGHRILLTFFSPSGFEVQKRYAGADWICYLPLDGPRTAKRFLTLTHPSLVIFVKYEFWYFYLKKIFYQKIPLLLVSALFREDMNFFKWYGTLSRKMLPRFQHLFLQNESSLQLVERLGVSAISSVAGDTRFDRVITIANQALPIDGIEAFAAGHPLLVAGSTWPEDEKEIHEALSDPQLASIKLIIAPHVLSADHINSIKALYTHAVCYSEWNPHQPAPQVMIMDNYGMLSRLYRYATLAYIGGGLHKAGIHNTLEAAVYAIPVLFGPHHKKHAEALDLLKEGAAFSFETHANAANLRSLLIRLLQNSAARTAAGHKAGAYVKRSSGATQHILNYIQENRLLTN